MDLEILNGVRNEVMVILTKIMEGGMTEQEMRHRRWDILCSPLWTEKHRIDTDEEFDQYQREKIELAIIEMCTFRARKEWLESSRNKQEGGKS